MQDNKELQEFDLDDILGEFQDLPEAGEDLGELSDDLAQLLGDWENGSSSDAPEEAPASAPMDTIRMNHLIASLAEVEPVQPEEPAAVPEEPAGAEAVKEEKTEEEASVPMDTIRMNELIDELAKEQPRELPEQMASADTIRVDLPETVSGKAPEEEPPMDTIRMNELIAQIMEQTGAQAAVPEDETIRVDDFASHFSSETEEEAAAGDDVTIRMDPLVLDRDVAAMAAEVQEQQKEEARIIYNPRTRLRELKKKLVAGPEKRYYELSEIGVAGMQIAIGLNLVLVVLCVIATTMYSLDMIPENRLRFVIFSQVLAMLLSAFLGCGQLMDGIGELFRGRFTINTMLGITFAACCADAVFCLSELRVPCCAAFSLEITMALWARYQRHTTEMAQMDSLRKAVRLNALVKESDFYEGLPGILRRDGDVEEFMDRYNRPSGPEKVQSIYCLFSFLLCIGIAVFAGMTHGLSMGIQIFATSLLVAVPASFFVSLTRPASLLERRLHMVGTVFCGWQGVKGLCGKAAFPLRDEDLFPANTTKLNGVKFYGDRDPDEVVSYTTSLIGVAGGGLVNVFRNMLESRNGVEHSVANFRDYGSGGIGGEVCDEPVLLGTLDFLQDMGVEIPEGTMVNQAVYAAIDGQLSAVFAISYAKMRSSAAGIISLCGNRNIKPVLTGCDFMLTDSLLRAKFSVNTRRIAFPDQTVRGELGVEAVDPEAPALALATRDDLASYAYAVSGAKALRTASRLGVAIHLVGGILGMLIMAALAYMGITDLLTPTHVLLYQLVWMIPGLLLTEWTRAV
ncbi:MAG: hypothetical protein IJE81_06935 [Oscillospiraceae bacterium]|nr:hypothetical protein [Oscillospiraceae bacterium]